MALPVRRFGDLADDIAARLPDREGLVFGASRHTFRAVAACINEAARRLIAAGVGHGEHVALWLNNCDDWIFIAFAVQKIGAVLVPINTRFRSREEHTFAEKILSAMRYKFGGHVEQPTGG